MSGFISKLSSDMEAMLNYREALGHSRKTYSGTLSSIDKFFAENYPDTETLTAEAVSEWINDQNAGIREKATALRTFGKYLLSIGKETYVLSVKFLSRRLDRPAEPYIFSDEELRLLFNAADKFPARQEEPFLAEIIPVMFRLIYTCGLRPNEGRELKRENINFKNGEILITNTKRKKERIVVMSSDMLKFAKQYDEKRAIFAHGSMYFFPSWKSGAFTNTQIGSYFRACWKLANPDIKNLPNVRVYDLRHRFASAVIIRRLNDGQPIMAKLPYLRAYMGHDNISETLYYIHLLPENLVKSSGVDWEALSAIMPEVTT